MNKMVRKTLAAVLALTVLSGGLPATVGSMDLLKPAIKVSAAEIDHGSCGENVSWVLDESGTLTISGTGAMQDKSDEFAPWYGVRSQITGIVIEDGVTSIGKFAFEDCSNSTAISIPDSVTSIGECAFQYCSSLTEVAIPDSVTSIGKYAFLDCSKLENVVMCSAEPAQLGSSAFTNTGSSLHIYVPNESVDKYKAAENWKAYADQIVSHMDIEWGCGADGINLTWKLEDGILTISGQGAMRNYANGEAPWYGVRRQITGVVIEDGVTSIGEYVFYESGLTAVTIPDSVTGIGQYAFAHCSNLSTVTIPESVTSIETGAFLMCSMLENVFMCSAEPAELGSSAFDFTDSSLRIYVPNESVGKYRAAENWNTYDSKIASIMQAEWGCGAEGINLTWTLEDGTLTISGQGAMRDFGSGKAPWYKSRNQITSVVIENGVTSIGNKVFHYLENLSEITIPNSVTSIGKYAFAYCDNLPTVTIPDSVTSIGEYAFYKSGLTAVTIPDSVTGIGQYAFAYCGNLATVTIPDNATTIADGLFCGCSSLTAFTIPDVVTSIGTGAFAETGLTAITIPDGVTSIEDSAFSGCTNLTEISIPDGVTSIGDSAFSGCTNLTEIIIPDGVTSIGESAFSECTNLTKIIIPDSVTSIARLTFTKCKSLTEITIPNSVISIGDAAFLDCTNLTEITVPDSVTSISMYAFCNCSSMTEVSIPDSVTSISMYAFYGCSSLTAITVPDSVTSIETATFGGCTGLTKIIIPDSVKSFGQYAFSGCTSLQAFIIPESVTTIEQGVFSGCTGLTKITIPNSVTSIGDKAFSNCSKLKAVTVSRTTPAELGTEVFSETDSSLGIYVPERLVSKYQKAENWSEYEDQISPFKLGEWDCGAELYGYNCRATLTADGLLTINGSGAMLDNVSKTAPWYQYNDLITDIVIEDGVTKIGNYAFYDCFNVTAVTIPDSVTSIGTNVFSGCRNLTEIIIPNGVTSIGIGAFANCDSLTKVTIPDSVTSIAESAFSGCSGLNEFTVLNPDCTIADKASTIASKAVIYGYSGSTAEAYATKYNRSFMKLAKIIGQPADFSGDLNETAAFSVKAEGTGLSYQWQFLDGSTWKNSGMTGAQTSTLSVTVTAARDGQQYRCIVSDPNGLTIISAAAKIKVKPAITTQPTTQELEVGQTARFTVAATGKNLKYQWQFYSSTGWKDSGMTGANTATLSVPVTAERDGQQYRCIVTGGNGAAATSNAASIKVKIPAAITSQPTTQELEIGQTAKFTVAATGTNLTYQWQFLDNGAWKNSGMTGAKTATLSVEVTAARNGQQYRCIVTASGKTLTSDAASIIVKTSAAITSQPTTQTLPIGQTAKFTVAATGSNLKYQWQFFDNGTWKNSGMTGATTATLNVPVTAARDGQQYRCLVTASGKSLTSNAASIKVKTAVTTQPTNQTGKIDSTVKFTVAASGTNLKYQWQFLSASGWQNSGMTGANTATLSVPVTAARDGQQYRCVVTSSNGTTATSNAAKLIAAVKITAQPKDYTGNINATAKFTVAAVGNNLSYQWQFSDNGVWKDSGMTGAKTNTLSVPITAARNGQKYRCVVKSANGTSEASSAATLKVTANNITTQPQNATGKVGDTVKFTVTASNATYQWQFLATSGWQNSGMTGAATATISVPVTEARDGQKYRCVVKFADGTTKTSNEVSLKVQAAITAQPQNASGKVGATAKFTIAASGTNLTYQWQFLSTSGWQNSGMTGAKTATISVPITDARNGQQYRCVVTSGNGTTATSNAAKLTVTK